MRMREYSWSIEESFAMSNAGPLAVEEHVHGNTVWVALRARGADWSWLTPEEAVRLGRQWLSQYGGLPREPATSGD